MAVQYGGLDITFVAAEDLSAMQYRFVHQASDTTVDMVDSAQEIPVGILQNKAAFGEFAIVRVTGTSKLIMNAAIAVASWVKCEYVGASDNGKGEAADKGNDYTRGLVVKASGAENDVGAVVLTLDVLSSAASPSTSVSASVSASPSTSVSASPSSSASPS